MRAEAHLSNAFSTIMVEKNYFSITSEEAQRPTERSMCVDCKEKVSLTPLYYPDTLVNPEITFIFGIKNKSLNPQFIDLYSNVRVIAHDMTCR